MARVTDIINAISQGTGQTYTRLSEALIDYCGAGYSGIETDGKRGQTYDVIQANLANSDTNSRPFNQRLSDSWVLMGSSLSGDGSKRWKQVKDDVINSKLF